MIGPAAMLAGAAVRRAERAASRGAPNVCFLSLSLTSHFAVWAIPPRQNSTSHSATLYWKRIAHGQCNSGRNYHRETRAAAPLSSYTGYAILASYALQNL